MFSGCCVVFEFSEVLLVSSSVLASILFLFYFCCFNSSISAFNAVISFDWFCWFVFYAFLVGDLELLLECFEVKDWSFWWIVGLSPARFLFWLILFRAIFVLFFKMLAYFSFRVPFIAIVCDVLDFSQYQVYAL